MSRFDITGTVKQLRGQLSNDHHSKFKEQNGSNREWDCTRRFTIFQWSSYKPRLRNFLAKNLPFNTISHPQYGEMRYLFEGRYRGTRDS